MAKKEATPLSVMTNGGGGFLIQGKEYTVKTLKIKDYDEFNKLNFGNQFVTLSDPAEMEKTNKFMARYLFDATGEPMTIEKTGADDWDIVDLKNFLRKVIEISG